MATIKYETVHRDLQTQARIARLENSRRAKVTSFPSVLLHIQSKEEVTFLEQYLAAGMPHRHIGGVVVPMDRMYTFQSSLLAATPKNFIFLTDIQNETLFLGSIKRDIRQFFSRSKTIPSRVKALVDDIQQTKTSGEKLDLHRELWDGIVNDKSTQYALIRHYVNAQMGQNMDILANIGPILAEKEDIDVVESMHEEAKNLYQGSLVDIEKDEGRMIGLHLALHKGFIGRKSNIRELFRMIERSKPRFLTYKLLDIDDIRKHPELVDKYGILMKGIGALSDEVGFPAVRLCCSTEGLIGHAWGVDAFSQPLKPTRTIETDFRMSSSTMQRLWQRNPELSSGQIYVYEDKDFMNRPDFTALVESNDGKVPSPIDFLSDVKLDDIKSMTAKTYRQYAKNTVMATRNLEEKEINDSIKNNDLVSLKNRYKKWLKNLNLFP